MDKYIILLGGSFHNDIRRTEQFLPHYLSKYGKVICFEYPQFLKLFLIIVGKLKLIEKVTPNLCIYHSFGLLPFGRTFTLINKLNHKINFFLFKFLYNNKRKKYNLISFTPEAYFFAQHFRSISQINYFIIDNYISLPFWDNPLQKKQFKYLEKRMLKITDKVIVVSPNLYSYYERIHNSVIYFRLPAELSPYLKYSVKTKGAKQLDLLNIKKPIAGFLGALYDWRIDIGFLNRVIRTYPDVSFVFLGTLRIKNQKHKKDALFKQKNFYYLGNKPQEDLPPFLSAFDVCLIPYKTDKYGKSAFPVKIIEYLAMGKPVVTTALPAFKYLRDKDLIYWAKTEEEFIHLLKCALSEKKTPKLVKRRVEEARKNSWEERIKEFITIIEND